ncbi:MAG: zf-HC2 domain-containing protein, partial [Eubacteriales bacterium]|nr:zf-HC2 domain-containing protein [Eubacteriales bacterium]
KNTSIDDAIKNESAGILERHAKKERTMAYKAGVVIALLLLVPIIITFIVSMSSGGGLGVFAVLTASMMLVASLIVIPLMSNQKRMAKSILAGVGSLLLIYFFVDRMNGGGDFILWAIPTIFGLSVIFFPIVIRSIELPPVLSDKKALITMTWDTLWLFLTIFEVCNRSGDTEGMKAGYTIAIILMIGVWLIFLTARYLPVNAWIKAGMIIMISCIWTAFSQDVYVYLMEYKKQLTILAADFSNWSDVTCTNANVYTLTLIFGGIVSAALLVYGMIRKKRS